MQLAPARIRSAGFFRSDWNRNLDFLREMVGLGRFELPTYGLGNRRSIHLSYSPVHLIVV